jgi:hypothetical protein
MHEKFELGEWGSKEGRTETNEKGSPAPKMGEAVRSSFLCSFKLQKRAILCLQGCRSHRQT